MAGNSAGGKAAAATNKELYGERFYADIGAIGGSRGRTGGFYGDSERARFWGSLGGRLSSRGNPRGRIERLRIRAQFEKNYAHLLDVHMKANAQGA